MDKYELVLDMIEHPRNYSSQELEALLADPEIKKIYDILCKTNSAMEADKEVDMDAEWEAFSKKASFMRRRFRIRGGRAASIVAIIFTSIVAMAVGVVVTVGITEHKSKPATAKEEAGDSLVSVMKQAEASSAEIEVTKPQDIGQSQILFEDEPLSVIMEMIGPIYGVEVKFNNKDVETLHLYYKFDPSMNLEEVVEQLNTFESINITKEGKTLIID